MVRVGLFFLLFSGLAFAAEDGRDCPFCGRRMAASEAPDPWTRAFACPSCRGVVHVFSDGTESGHVYRYGRREIYVIDPHAVTRPDHSVVRPAPSVSEPNHAVTRPAHPVERSVAPVSRPAHSVRPPEHAVGRTTHSVTRPAHAVSRPSHTITRPRTESRPMYAEQRTRAKLRTYAQPYRARANAYRR